MPVVPDYSKLELTGGKWPLLACNISANLRQDLVHWREKLQARRLGTRFLLIFISAEGEHVFYTHATGIH